MGNILKSYPKYYNFTPQANMVIMVGESNVNKNFYTTTEGILYKGEYSDSIYSFDEDYNLKPAILLHLGKYTVPLHLRPEYLADPDKIQPGGDPVRMLHQQVPHRSQKEGEKKDGGPDRKSVV